MTAQKIILLIMAANVWAMYLVASLTRKRRRSQDNRPTATMSYLRFVFAYLPRGWKLWFVISSLAGAAAVGIMFITSAALATDQGREFSLRGWVFDIPSFLAQKVQDGPDFTVTYFSSAKRKMSLGIYEGTAPKQFAEGKTGVREEKDQIGAQKATWALWEEGKPEGRTFH